MLRRGIDCPHCGNEIIVNNAKQTTKCRWCRRIVSVRFVGNGKGAKVYVEAIDFQPSDPLYRSYDNWKDEDIYGH